MQHAQACVRRWIVGATADNDVYVRVLAKHASERLSPHLRHDVHGVVDGLMRQLARRAAFSNAPGR